MADSDRFPRIDLTTFFLSISSAAFYGLGIQPSQPQSDGAASSAPPVDLELARQNIDLLELMHEKTKGNRTPDEDRLIDHLLFETRMRFVEAQQNQQQQQKK